MAARILYVEDNHAIAEAMIRMFETTEHTFVVEHSIAGALARLESESFDLEIWDGNIHEGLDGVAKAVARHSLGKKVLVYSSHWDAERLAKGRGVPYLFKPTEEDKFLAKIEELTSK